jgi:hypothetical protein
MGRIDDGAVHLQGVTFQISYPPGPFYPSGQVSAKFSGVLTSEGQFHVKLDSGSIPGNPTVAGVPVRGTFSVGPEKMPMSFSGSLSDNRISGTARAGRSSV